MSVFAGKFAIAPVAFAVGCDRLLRGPTARFAGIWGAVSALLGKGTNPRALELGPLSVKFGADGVGRSVGDN